ncbi:MAG: DUF2784 domain-containing protein [Stackebrandtia sp.]
MLEDGRKITFLREGPVRVMGWQVLAQVVMTVHFLVLVYMALGGFLAWRWPKAWYPHAAMAGWGLLNVVFMLDCPLTHLENYARENAGWDRLGPDGFIYEYFAGVIFPEDQMVVAQWIVAVAVAVSWTGALWRLQRVRRALRSPASAVERDLVDA